MDEPGIVTLLFTDLVGSTEMLGRLGEHGAEALRRFHFRLLREAVATHRGQEVKNLGDGLMVVFASAVEAVGCAVSIQRAVDRRSQESGSVPFEVRIGLHLGEPIRHEGDFFGTPVVVASRLCSLAAGGEILTSEVLRSVVAARSDFAFRSLGGLSLKGMSEVLPACAVEWQPEAVTVAESTATPPVALPAGLLDPGRVAFVGREAESAQLRELWQRTLAAEPQVVFLAGEPGIGKTRLSSQLAAEVLATGASVLYGRCDEESVVPYQPFVEGLRQLPAGFAGALPPDQRADLARLLPELSGRGAVPNPPAPDPETERYRFFEAVVGLLAAAARHSPLVLVLDDLHWASRPTVLLLRHVVRSWPRLPLLILGTYRDVEVTRAHPLSGLLSELRRDGVAVRIQLRGLSTPEVRTLLEARAGHEFDHSELPLYEAVWRSAEGNPFFILEINRHLAEAGRLYVHEGRWRMDAKSLGELDLPEGVRDVVGRRLARLSETANQVLSTAAVLGRQFPFELVAHMVELTDVAVLAALDEALEARLVLELPAASTTSYSFTHALVREALLGELSRARRQWLHLRGAQAMEVVWGGRLEGRAAALAGHYSQAGDLAPPDKAIDALLSAGDEAAAALAWEEVSAHWEAALDLMERTGAEAARRADLLARHADLFFVAGFDLRRSIECAEKAVGLFQEMDDRPRVAVMRSRLGGYLTTNATYGVMDVPRGLRELREAARVLGAEPDSLAYGYVQGSLGAAAGIWAAQLEEGLTASRLAMDIGEARGHDPLWVMGAMLAGFALCGLGGLKEGLALMEQAWATADRLDHRYLATRCVHCRTCWTTLIQDPLATSSWAERELSKRRLAHAPIQRHVIQGQLAWARAQCGNLAEAREVVDDIMELPIGVFRPSLELWDGEWRAAEDVLVRARDEHRGTGNRFDEARVDGWIADCSRIRGDHDRSEQFFQQALDIVRPLGHRVLEVQSRIGLGLVALERSRPATAREHIVRARGLVAGEGWGGLLGRLELVDAALQAAEGDLPGAETGFARAVDNFRRHTLPWEEAEAFFFWGRAIARTDGGVRARDRMDDALAVYDRVAAAESWRARVERERALLA